MIRNIVLRNFAIIVKKANFWPFLLHCNLGIWQTSLRKFSFIQSTHKTLKSATVLLRIFRTSYVLSKCVQNMKPWTIGISIANNVENFSTYFGRTRRKFFDYFRLFRQFAEKVYVISHNCRGYDAQFLLRRFLDLYVTAIDNGRYQNF